MAEQIIAANSGAKQQIVVVQGEAFIKDARGQLQAIKAGDVLLEGQVIVTDAQGHLTILLPNGQIIELGADRSLLIDGDLLGTAPTDSTEAAVAKTNDSADQIINALNEGKDLSTDLEATAAGLSAGAGGGEGSGFVRLMRIAEGVDPLSFNFATALDTFEPPPTANFADAIAAEIIADNKNPEFVDTNNIPLGTDQTTTTPEDTPVSGQLVAKDDNGDVLIFSKTSDPSHGTVVVNANGAYTYIPNKDYTGPDSFQVQVSDGKGGTDTLTVNVGVTPVNDAPVASNDSASTVINTPILNINVLANDKDIDGDTLTITSAQAQDPSKGTVSINPDGTINFIPANNVLGPVVINYSISDGKGGTDTAQLTINVGDVSTPPIQKIEVGQPGLQDDSVIEGNQLVFNVTLSAASPKAESYSFNLGNGTASTIDYGTASFSNGVTYDASTGKITVPAGVNSFSVTLPTVDDNLVEGSETVLLNIGGQTATGTILDNDSSTLSVTPALDNVSVSEGSAADFTVKLSNPSATDTQVTLNLITTGTNGNASAADVAGLQYKDSNGSWVNVPANGQVTIAAGQTEVIVRVPTVQDGVYEGKENFTLNATVNGNTVSGQGSIIDDGTGTIPPEQPGTPDNDQPKVASVSSPSVTEGGNLVFDVQLDHSSTTATKVNLNLANGSGIVGTDTSSFKVSFDNGVTYVDVTGGQVSVPAGTTSIKVQVATVNDNIVEGNETITLTAKSEFEPAAGAGQTGTGTILDNDSSTLSVTPALNNVSVSEGSAADFTVKLSNPSATDTQVTLKLITDGATGNASAADVAGLQYKDSTGNWVNVPANGQVTIAAGQTEVIVRVPTVQDGVYEGKENFTLDATVNGNTVSGQGSIIDDGTGTIPPEQPGTPDNDQPKVASVSSPSVTEGGNLVFDVQLDHSSTTATTVNLNLANGSGIVGTDTNSFKVSFDNGVTYVNVTGGQVSVPAGTTSIKVQVATVNDNIVEGNETITLTAKSEFEPAAGAGQTGTGTILDNDSSTLSVTPALDNVSVSEGSAADFTVKLSNPSATDTQVTLNLITTGTNGNASATDVAGLQYKDSNGSWVNVPANGQVTIAAGQTEVIVRVPTVQDGVYEGKENFTLNATVNGNTVSGQGSIIDDGTGTIPPEQPGTPDNDQPKVASVSSPSVTEGGNLVFDVQLDHSSTTATTVNLNLANGSGIVGTDTNSFKVSFDNGVTYVDVTGGQVSVPAGTTSIKVQVATVNDNIVEGNETITLTAKSEFEPAAGAGQTGTGTILDNDSSTLSVTPALNNVSVSEGSAADFTVKLSNPSATDTQVTLKLITDGATGNASATDVAGLQYKDSNGSWVNVPANGQVTIAAGQTEVIVRVPTVQDGVYEGKENFTLNATVNGNTVSGQGSIIDDGTGTIPPEQPGTPDNDQPKVASVSSPSVTEGGNLVFDVQLDHSSTTATKVNLNLANGSGIVGTDTSSFKVSFDNGVTYVDVTGGQVSVPAGTTSIKVQVATVNDNIVEGNETITLTAKSEFEPAAGAGQTGTGTILDNDSSTLSVTPALNNVSVSEGSAADFTVKLSNPSATDTQVTLKLITDGATGNASAADVAGLQYKDSTGNWVNVPANGQVTIAAGQTEVIVRVPTVQDGVYEGKENFTLNATVNGNTVSGQGSIIDDGTGTIPPEQPGTPDNDQPKVASVSSPSVTEGGNLVFDVQLDHSSTTATTVNLNLANGSGIVGTDTNSFKVSFDNGVTYVNVTGGQVSVPAGTTSIKVQVATVNDNIVEGNETITLTAKSEFEPAAGAGQTGTGTILDNDSSTLSVTPALDNVSVSEGSAADFTVKLSNPSATDTQVTLNLITTGTNGNASATDVAGLQYKDSNGSWVNVPANGQVTIAAGQTEVIVRVPTVQDGVYEGKENFTLNATVNGNTVSGQGSIIDDGTGTIPPEQPGTPDNDQPKVASVSSPSVTEGGNLVFDVQLDHSSTTATTVNLNLANGSGIVGTDTNSFKVSFDNGVTYVNVTGGQVSVPAGTTSIKVQVATVNDNIVEGNETITLTAKSEFEPAAGAGQTGTGTILDNDSSTLSVTPALNNVSVSEGSAADFTVKLSNPSATDTQVTLKLITDGATGNASAADVAGLQYKDSTGNWVNVPANGQVTIAAGQTEVIVRVPTVQDGVYEGKENFTLDATVNGNTVSGQGSIIDDGTGTIPPEQPGTPDNDQPKVASVSSPSVTEGGNLVFDVQLDHSSTTATKVNLNLANGSGIVGTDTSSFKVSFDNGVTYVDVTGGQVSVPAGTTSIKVQVATVNDNIVEGNETITLTAKSEFEPAAGAGQTGTGTILDNDSSTLSVTPALNNVSVSEGSAADFTVKLSNPSATDTQVTLKLITDGATGNASAADVAGLQYKDSTGNWVNVPANGQVTIAAGQTEVIVRVPTVQDGVYEGKENFTLDATVNGNTVSGQGSIIDDGTGTIPPEQPGTPDNDQPKVASVSSPSVTEGGNLVFDVQLDHSSTTATTVNLNLANGSGIVGTDTNSFKVSFDNGVTYVNVTGGQVSVPAGTTSIKVQVATVNDNIVEGNETITLTAKSEFEPAAGAGQTGTGTILDNDSSTLSVTPALDNVSVSEGSAADFTVKLSNPSATDTQVTLNLITTGTNGNASATDVAGLQYKDSNGSWVNVPANGQVTIAAGQTEVIVRVPTVQDGVYEGKENFTLNATVNGNTVSGQGSIIDDGTGTIPPEQPGTPDNDQPKVASVSSPSVTEGGNLVFDVQLDHSSTTATTVNLNLANGSGIVGTDTNSFKVSFDNGVTYVNVTGGQVSVPAGTTSIKVQVATVNDNIVEGNETITLTAKSEFEPAAGAGQTGTGTILDNDSSTLSVTPALNNVSVSEGSAADFTVKLSNPSATDTQVTLKLITDGATGNASAADVAGLQYKDSTGNWVNVPANGQVTIAAGQTEVIVRVPTVQDGVYEGKENFTLDATVNGNTVSGQGSIIDDGTGTIPPEQPGTPDNDQPKVASVSSPSVTEGGNLVFDVQLDHSSTTATTVNLNLANGSGIVGTDTNSFKVSFDNGVTYVNVTGGQVSVPAGTTSIKVQVATVNDNIVEGNETITLTAKSEFEPAAGAGQTGTGTILDNDINPETNATTATGDEDTLIAVNLNGSDVDGTVANFKVTSLPANGKFYSDAAGTVEITTASVITATNNGATIYFKPNANWNGDTTFQYAATDNSGLADATPANGKITVNAVNDAPETNATTATGDEDTLIAVNLNGSDTDGTVANFSVTTLPANGTFYSDAAGTIAITADSVITATNNGATIYFKPDANWNGDTTFQYTATDNTGLTDATPANGKITVNAVNDAPDAIDDPATTTGLKSEYFVYHEGSNLDGSNLTSLAMVNDFIASHSASAVFTAKTFNYNLGNGDLGANNNLQTFLGSDAASLSTDPENSSDAIIRMTGNITLAAGTYNFKVLADDGYVIYVDGKKVAEVDRIQSPTGTEHASFTIATGGNHTIEILYWDQGGQAVFKPELRQGSDAYQSLGNFILTSPVPYSTAEDTPLNISGAALLANDKDPDGDILTITSVQGATNGSVTLVNGNVVFTPAPNYTGPASFTYTISDGKGGTDTATVSLHVTAVNDAPDTANITASGAEDTLIAVNLSGSDVDGSVRSFNLTTLPSTGTFYSDAAGTVAITAATVIAATANGATIYFKPNANWNGDTTFQYAAKDVYGVVDPTPATGTISVTPVNDAPTFVSGTSATVSEEGLTGGIADTAGTTDSTDTKITTGNVTFSDVDNSSLTYTLTAPAPGPAQAGLTSGGQAIVWSGNGSDTLVGTVGNQTIVTISIDGTGKYTVTLSGPVDHADKTTEDLKSFNVTVSASDGKLSSSGQVTINIEDDAPVGQNTTTTVQMPYISTNLILTLDTSGSMGDPSGIAGKTRLQVAKEALTQLINDYDNVGDVKVMLVGFSSSATTQLFNGNTWLTATEAKAILANFTASGGTNYDAAAGQVMQNFDKPGKLVGGQNVGYFFSDGAPNTGLGLDTTETKAWTDFLNNKDINSLAIGLGTGVAGTNLDPLAYNGTGSGTEANSIIVTDLAQLPPILRDTILTPTAGNITGGLVGSTVSGFGADGGHINDITVNGVKYTFNTAGNSITTTANGSTYSFDPVTHTLKVTTTLGGQFIIDMDDGKYTYTPPVNLQSNTSENIGFTLIDNDGDLDKSNSKLTINVIPPRYNSAPVLVDDFSFTKANQAISLDVLANDKDLQGDKLTLTGTPTLLSGQGVVTIDPKTGLPVFTPSADFIGEATIRYTVSDGFGGTSSAIWTVKVVPESNILDGSNEGGVGSYFVQGPESGAGTQIYVSSAGFGQVGGVTYFSNATSTDQVILTGGSNDHVEAGAGNDLIYTGETQDINNSVALKDENFFLNSKLMNDADGTLSTVANNDKLVQSIVNEMQPVADLVNAGSGNDTVFGENGSDALYGNAGNDKLFGGAGIDALRGGAGNDLLAGGSGNDILRGDAGSDTFKWTLGDQGTAGAPARDVVMDFNNAKSGNAAGDVDKLDLRDLLQGENTGSLTQYLHFEKSGSDTIIHVSSKGEFSNGNWTAKEDQVITLQGVDLTTSGSDQAIINDLLSKGRLITD